MSQVDVGIVVALPLEEQAGGWSTLNALRRSWVPHPLGVGFAKVRSLTLSALPVSTFWTEIGDRREVFRYLSNMARNDWKFQRKGNFQSVPLHRTLRQKIVPPRRISTRN